MSLKINYSYDNPEEAKQFSSGSTSIVDAAEYYGDVNFLLFLNLQKKLHGYHKIGKIACYSDFKTFVKNSVLDLQIEYIYDLERELKTLRNSTIENGCKTEYKNFKKQNTYKYHSYQFTGKYIKQCSIIGNVLRKLDHAKNKLSFNIVIKRGGKIDSGNVLIKTKKHSWHWNGWNIRDLKNMNTKNIYNNALKTETHCRNLDKICGEITI